MSNISLKLSKEKIAKLKETFKEYIVPSPNEYIDTFIKNDDLTISIYKNEKVVFQGKDALFYGSAYLDIKNNRQAGSDEVGTGDYFGPVCVCACIIEEKDYEYINKTGITDSKKMTDETILDIAPYLINKLKHSLLILDNKTYNKVHMDNNLNEIKAKLHNQAYINMKNKGYNLPNACYIDEFANENLYYSYLKNETNVFHNLTFETKAESKYPAVACASVIARYAFLQKMKEMEQKYKMSFHKGAGEDVDKDAISFVNTYGKEHLNEVAKLHFKNTEKII